MPLVLLCGNAPDIDRALPAAPRAAAVLVDELDQIILDGYRLTKLGCGAKLIRCKKFFQWNGFKVLMTRDP